MRSRSTTSSLLTKPSSSVSAQVDLVEPLGHRGRALEVVALDQHHATAAGHERVADDVRIGVGLVLPRAPGVRLGGDVELVDEPAAQHGSSANEPSTIGYRSRPSAEPAIASKPRLDRHARPSPGCQVGLAGDLPSGNSIGGASTLPVASTWSRNGPNSSPIQNVPSARRTTDSMSKSPPVSSRSGVVRVDDRERDQLFWVAQARCSRRR